MSEGKKEKKASGALKKIKKAQLTKLQAALQSTIFGWFLFGLLVIGISLILSFHLDYLPGGIRVGKIAPKNIKADRNYEIVDTQASEANRREAFQSIPPVFDFDPGTLRELEGRVKDAFSSARLALSENRDPEQIKTVFQNSLGIGVSKGLFQKLLKTKFSTETQENLIQLLRQAMEQKILLSYSVLPPEIGNRITIRDIQTEGEGSETLLTDLTSLKSLEEVQLALPELAKGLVSQGGSSLEPAYLVEFATPLILPNTTYNAVETDLRRARAVSHVPNVILKVQAGEAIIRSGDRYEPYHLTILEGIRKQKSETSFIIKLVGTALFVSLILLISYLFPKKFIRKFDPTREDLYFLGGVLVLLLLSVRLAATLSAGLRDFFPYDVSVQALYYAIPVAGGAMLTRFILNSEISLVFAIVASALTGLFLQADLDLSIYYLISGIVAAAAIARVDRRTAILRAGVIVGLVNALVILAIKLITVVSVTDMFSIPDVLVNCVMGFLGGIFASIFVMVLAPIAELVFNYVTDIKLLELGNLNHPLLRDMIVKAPGTYHHSQLVAVLAEAAAAEIGANPLLARVGSYFHDIGKMRKPAYFIENQQGGENRHDKLSPSMSALIIASHVKDGLELAKEYKLPGKIADFIPQHQGTKLITFFYNKALALSEEKDSPVDEKHYRYPGPRPQTREAGIILLADGVEASVRSLPEKTPQKIQAKVQQIINKNFTEEQLDECEMTLKDLHVIAETFTRVLIGIYHQRIAYPEVEEKKATVTPLKEGLAKKGHAR